MRVLLIRHAECADNVVEAEAARRRMDGAAFAAYIAGGPESPLTDAGRAQAQRLAERLRRERIDRLYTSPYPRARDTAGIVGGAIGLAPVRVDALRELEPPVRAPVAGRSPRERALRWHLWPAYARMLLSPASPERLPVALARVRAAWAEVTREPAGVVAVVTHGMVLHLLLPTLAFDRRWRVRARDFSNAGVSVVESRWEP